MKVIQRVPQSNYFDLLFSISQSYPLLLLLAGDIATGASSSETITCCCCVSDLPTRCALAVIWLCDWFGAINSYRCRGREKYYKLTQLYIYILFKETCLCVRGVNYIVYSDWPV